MIEITTLMDYERFIYFTLKHYCGLPRPKPPRNSTSPVPAPTSAFLSPVGPPGPRLYPARSSVGLDVSLLVAAAGRGLVVSDLVCLFKVEGTISGGR